MKRYLLLSIGALTLLGLLTPVPASHAQERRFEFQPGVEDTEVRFRSEATLEDFEGHGDQLSGWFALDPADLTTLRGELEFDLSCLDTGLGLRNKHMHDNVLETDEHPTARLVVEGCEAGSLQTAEMPVEIEGTLELHGVSKPMKASVTASMVGENLRIEATFRVKLNDHGIKRPKMLVLKVAKEVELTVRALARPQVAETSPEKVDGR